jgi:hypothetical protein
MMRISMGLLFSPSNLPSRLANKTAVLEGKEVEEFMRKTVASLDMYDIL